jgi:hypothetical protein
MIKMTLNVDRYIIIDVTQIDIVSDIEICMFHSSKQFLKGFTCTDNETHIRVSYCLLLLCHSY